MNNPVLALAGTLVGAVCSVDMFAYYISHKCKAIDCKTLRALLLCNAVVFGVSLGLVVSQLP